MEFELAPNNRDQPGSLLLEDLRAAAAKLGARKVTREAYSAVGRFSAATIASRFGGWGRALEKAGLTPSRHFSVSKEECIADLRRVAAQLGVEIVTLALYKRHGRFAPNPFARHFGNWIGALEAAGLGVSEQYYPRSSDEELFENLEAVWQRLGRQPTVNDMFAPVSRFSAYAYKRRFGGFRRALEAFVAASQESFQVTPVGREPVGTRASNEQPAAPRVESRSGNRSVGWRLRYLVLHRDQFRCQACGRSPAVDAGTTLQVDHIIPWAHGGATVEANLQTLCERCNVGKGTA